MARFKITVEYDGRDFAGWQRQKDEPSVQAALEAAIASFSGEQVAIHGAGRTDAGVHAAGQVAHFDLQRSMTAERLREAINAFLRPAPIAVLEVEAVSEDFHARFSAVRRHYRYDILNRRAPPALRAGRVWHVPVPLNLAAMRAGAEIFVGHHDFTTFRSSHCQADNPERTLDDCRLEAAGERVHLQLSSRAFLHNQVRSMVGSLVLVGQERWSPQDLAAALAAKDRRRCGPVAPPDGLTLLAVDYL